MNDDDMRDRVNWNDDMRDRVNTPFLTEADVRRIVREELAAAFRAHAREADEQDGYDTAELDSRALSNIRSAAEGTARRLTCPHEAYETYYSPPRCSRCGEPGPEQPTQEEQIELLRAVARQRQDEQVAQLPNPFEEDTRA